MKKAKVTYMNGYRIVHRIEPKAVSASCSLIIHPIKNLHINRASLFRQTWLDGIVSIKAQHHYHMRCLIRSAQERKHYVLE